MNARLLLSASVAVAVAWALGGTALPEPPEVVDLSAPPASSWLRTEWFSVHGRGAGGEGRVGWLRRSLARVTWEGRPAVERQIDVHVQVADAAAAETRTRTVYLEDAPQLLVVAEVSSDEQGRRRSRTVVRRDSRFDVTTTRGAQTLTGAVVAFDVRLRDEVVLERLARAAAADPGGARGRALEAFGLDVPTMSRTKRRFEVAEVEADAPGGPVFAVRSPADGPATPPLRIDAAGRLLSGPFSEDFVVRSATEAAATDAAGLTSVEALTRVPLDAQLGDVTTISRLVFTAEGLDARLVPASPRQKVTAEGSRLRIEVVRDASPGKTTPEERAAALTRSQQLDWGERALRDAADAALAGTSQRVGQVDALLKFVAARLEDEIVLGDLTASEVLAAGRGDCTEHARLFVALCRAAGIPAREVTGLAWTGDGTRTLGHHAWAEVELQSNWRPVDPTQARMPADAARIELSPSTTTTSLRDVKFAVESVERDAE